MHRVTSVLAMFVAVAVAATFATTPKASAQGVGTYCTSISCGATCPDGSAAPGTLTACCNNTDLSNSAAVPGACGSVSLDGIPLLGGCANAADLALSVLGGNSEPLGVCTGPGLSLGIPDPCPSDAVAGCIACGCANFGACTPLPGQCTAGVPTSTPTLAPTPTPTLAPTPTPTPAMTACTRTANGPLRGSAIALTSDDSRLITVNRDVGTVTVMSVAYGSGSPVMSVVGELPVGAEPWQVAIDACNQTAWVVLRKDQQLVEITNVEGTPAVGRRVAVGSEPTSLVVTPNNTKIYVSNWVDGTLSVIQPATMTVTGKIDLNGALANTNMLGPGVNPRPALAHPRALAITNNGDGADSDETVYATEWYAARTAPETTSGDGADTNHEGLLYAVPVNTGVATAIALPAVSNTGFNDAKGNTTGCFPNQVGSVSISGGFAYVTSTCASPVGPVGVFQKGACDLDSQCSGGAAGSCVNGACKNSCTVDSDCGVGSASGACNVAAGGVCAPLAANAKTTTHPALSIVNVANGTATTQSLDKPFATAGQTMLGTASTRMPLLPTDLGFDTSGNGYVAAEGTDALFRFTVINGTVSAYGTSTNDFVNVSTASPAFSLPIGIAVSQDKGFAFVANDGTRDVAAIDLSAQAIAAGPAVEASTALPSAGSPAAGVLAGKQFFTSGLNRWSLNGAGWGSCASCHIDGLSDNITWYFARGPRQTISLDGTFSKSDTTDQRILNWTAIYDEIADLENYVRGLSGGVGAIVSTVSNPPANSDRINLFSETPQQLGLQGSSTDAANPAGTSSHQHSVINDWADITSYIQQIRSPRAPTGLNPSDVSAGQTLFTDSAQGNCVACHSGPKWTISKVFYTPGDTPNDAFTTGTPASTSLSGQSWLPASGFPAALYPSTTAGEQTMRSGAPPSFEQLQCVLRPVGTIVANGTVPNGVSSAEVNVLELRQDMVTGAQGAGGTNANDFTFGFNPPSMLGLSVGAPYFHAGNARTLEEMLSGTFVGHYQSAVAPSFSPTATQIQQLVAFLLSIDGSTATAPIPPVGSSGGDICNYTQ